MPALKLAPVAGIRRARAAVPEQRVFFPRSIPLMNKGGRQLNCFRVRPVRGFGRLSSVRMSSGVSSVCMSLRSFRASLAVVVGDARSTTSPSAIALSRSFSFGSMAIFRSAEFGMP